MKLSSYKFKLMSGSSSHTSFNSAGEKDKVLSEHKGLTGVTAV